MATASLAHSLLTLHAPSSPSSSDSWLQAWPIALPSLRRSALHLTRDRDEAEDLLQETALRAHRFATAYRSGTCARAWLHRILRNTFASRYRKRRREREIIERAQIEGALTPHAGGARHEPAALHDSLSDEVTRSLSALAPEFRKVLVSVAVDGLSYRETAAAIGCPIGTVMSRLHRARGAMQASLEGAELARSAA